ncbi:glycosyltransferase family 9 protein [Luteibacter aegosomatissinici]|uniref:glycosyltransferase family 9 protein n=1 Tax=Luteibacter aegosomatissinici TaxID=2911539 RepID=UPI001FF70330|nr:glycosyltransferase family 9 protein [Luteibacter aegosomatissinici]UPG96038.1 glycosyltransferase family 9 protein [Luteibacter aegosomatissinici]
MVPHSANIVGPGELPRGGIQRILVCRPNHRLGNTLMVTPLIAELEARFPGAEVDILGSGAATQSVFAGYPSIGELFLLDRRALRRPIATARTIGRLRSKRYDLVIDAASGSSSGRIASSMAQARYQIRVEGTGGSPTHFAMRPVHALRVALGISPTKWPSLDLRLRDTERATGMETLQRVLHAGPEGNAAPVLAIFPNATGAKRHDTTWWQRFIAELTAGIGERRIVELVAADGVSRLDNAYPTYFTSDPRKLAAFIDAAGTYISADCGVMHLAAATRATTIGLFSRTDPKRYAPIGDANASVICEDGCPERTAARVAALLSGASTRA